MGGVLQRQEDQSPPPPTTWSWGEAVAVFLGSFLLGHALRLWLFGGVPSPTAYLAWQTLAELTWIVVIAAWLRLRHRGWVATVGRPARAWEEARDGAVFGLILYGVVALGVVLPLSWVLGLVSDRNVRAPEPLPEGLPPVGVALALIFALIVAPAAEELFFRGVLFRALHDRHGTAIAVTGSAVAFGLVHYVPGTPIAVVVVVAAAVATGVGLAIQYERRRNLLAPLAAHVAFNALGLLTLLRT